MPLYPLNVVTENVIDQKHPDSFRGCFTRLASEFWLVGNEYLEFEARSNDDFWVTTTYTQFQKPTK